MEIFQGSRTPTGVYAESTMRCLECNTYISHIQEDAIVRFLETDERSCYGCGVQLYHQTVAVDIRPTSERFLDAANVKNSIWYHATDRRNWIADLLNGRQGNNYPLVHVGTREAALAIISDQYVRRDDWIYLYAVKLASTAIVDATLYEDENMWPSRTNDADGTANIFRYVNRYEATGSISLLMDPRALVVTNVEILTPEQAEEMVRQCETFGLAVM
jgi:1,2-phenylacetyl-CoA epoxidase PaaB subunit